MAAPKVLAHQLPQTGREYLSWASRHSKNGVTEASAFSFLEFGFRIDCLLLPFALLTLLKRWKPGLSVRGAVLLGAAKRTLRVRRGRLRRWTRGCQWR